MGASSRSPAMRNNHSFGFGMHQNSTSSPDRGRGHGSTASHNEVGQHSLGNVTALRKQSSREEQQRQQSPVQGCRDASPIVARNEISAMKVFHDMIGGIV